MTDNSVATIDRPTHVPELDGIRGVAALMVLVWHFVGAGLRGAADPLAQGAGQILMFGRTGVDLFFVLSGFLITRILIADRGQPRTIAGFLVRRFFRIWPAYLLLIALALILQAVLPATILTADGKRMFNDTIPLWTYLVFGQNIAMSVLDTWGAGALSVTWSVAIEEHFYLVFPFVVALVRPTRLPHVLVALGLASAIARAVIHLRFPHLGYAPYVLTPLRLDGLCAGALLALWTTRLGGIAGLARWRGIIRLAAAVSALPALALIWSYASPHYGFHQYVWGHAWLSVFYAALLAVVLVEAGGRGGTWLSSRVLRHAGDLSYVLYLFHPLILGGYFLVVFGTPERLDRLDYVPHVLIAAVLTYAICLGVHLLVERPLRMLGRRLAERWSHTASTP
jgi:peptidoglycan/LPS O-acetylase OafA/YrhL